MIEIRSLVKSFDGFRALDGLDLTVPDGAVYGLCGSNGAGKSTAIRHLAGILRQLKRFRRIPRSIPEPGRRVRPSRTLPAAIADPSSADHVFRSSASFRPDPVRNCSFVNTPYKPSFAEPIPQFRRLTLRWHLSVFPDRQFAADRILQDYQLLPAVLGLSPWCAGPESNRPAAGTSSSVYFEFGMLPVSRRAWCRMALAG